MKDQLIETLTVLNSVANAAQLAHWNVTGKDFYQLHLLFERIYGTLSGQLDGLAEQARGCGVEIPAKIFNSVPEIEYGESKELIKEIGRLNSKYKSSLKDLHEDCGDEGNLGLVNVLEGYLTEVNTVEYLLKSVLDLV
jgi:starvation-inducible DNA-binding protein